MCYYNGQKVTRDELIRLKQLEKAVAHYDFLNRDLIQGFDYGMNAVLKPVEGKIDFEIVQMEWGFIPDKTKWPFIKCREDLINMRKGYKDKYGKYQKPITMLNAVSEELLLQNKVYRDAALNRRCLVLSTGFYEWRHIHPISKKTGLPLKSEVTYPYRISLTDKSYFLIAGIWQPWTDEHTGEYVESDAIVTTTAVGNKIMEQVHNSKKRMPTILNEDLAWEWMFEKLDERRISEIAKTQYPWQQMQAYPIAKDFRISLDPVALYDYPKEELPDLELSN